MSQPIVKEALLLRNASRVPGHWHAITNPLKLHRPLRHPWREVERPEDESRGRHGREARQVGADQRRLTIGLNVVDHVVLLFIRLVGATVGDEAFEG